MQCSYVNGSITLFYIMQVTGGLLGGVGVGMVPLMQPPLPVAVTGEYPPSGVPIPKSRSTTWRNAAGSARCYRRRRPDAAPPPQLRFTPRHVARFSIRSTQ